LKHLFSAILLGASLTAPALAQPEADQMRAAAAALEPVLEKAGPMLVEGRRSDVINLVLATFPEAARTPVQSLALGNVLFIQTSKKSYELHKLAAGALPQSPDALLEWALEQHRAKEYDAAAKTYEAYSRLSPEHAPPLGLAAECRLRTGDVAGALACWEASEKAESGTLEDFESLVCEVNGSPSSDEQRERLLGLVGKGDVQAAEVLILYDLTWEQDWWNIHTPITRLQHDLGVVKGIADPSHRVRAPVCRFRIPGAHWRCGCQYQPHLRVEYWRDLRRRGFRPPGMHPHKSQEWPLPTHTTSEGL